MASTRRRVTYGQLEMLAEILSANKDVALGFNKAAHARARSRLVWEQVTTNLNSMGEGAQKTWKEWSIYWVDYKAKLKKKAAIRSEARPDMARTGGSLSSDPDFNNVEEKFLRLLAPNSDLGLSDAQPAEQPVPEQVPVLEAEDAMSTDLNLEPAPEEEAQEYYVIRTDDCEHQSAQTPAEVTPANDTPATAGRARSRRRRRGDIAWPSVSDTRRSVISSNNESIEIMRGILSELRRLADLVSVALER